MNNILLNVCDPLFLRLTSCVLAAVFFLSGAQKIRDLRNFERAVAAYRLLPRSWVHPFTHILPGLELALGFLLLIGWQVRLAAFASVALLIVFIFAMSINLARGRREIDCGCSGKKNVQKIGWKTITRNLVLILLALPVVFMGSGFLTGDSQLPNVQTFILETLILNSLIPLTLCMAGMVLLPRLLKETIQLVMLTTGEKQPSEDSEIFQRSKQVYGNRSL